MSYPWNAGDTLNAADLDAISLANLYSSIAAEAITAADAVRIGLYQSDGGILYDNSGNVTGGSATVVVGVNSNRLLIFNCMTNGGAPAPTYNGVAMTLIQSSASFSGFFIYSYRLVAPATGSHTLAWTTGSTTYANYYSFYNCDQTTGIDASSVNTFSVVQVQTNVTPLVEGDILMVVGGNSGVSIFCNEIAIAQHPLSPAGQFNTAHSLVIEGIGTTYECLANDGVTDPKAVIGLLIKPFAVMQRAVYRANSSDATHADSFIGFANASAAKDATVMVTTSGVVSGLSGLSTAAKYYLNDTSGVIGTSAGTVTRKVGVALSQTKLLITNIW